MGREERRRARPHADVLQAGVSAHRTEARADAHRPPTNVVRIQKTTILAIILPPLYDCDQKM